MSVLVNRERLLLVTPPLAEPVTLEETKLYVGQDLNHHDELLRSLISAARTSLEQTYGVVYMPQTYEQLATWVDATSAPPIRLLRRPVQSIESVTIIDPATGVERVIAAERVLKIPGGGVRVEFVEGVTLPASYLVRFVAGYGLLVAPLTVSFDAASKTITRATGSWLDDGLTVGMTLYTSDTKAPNQGPLTISDVSALVLTVSESLANSPDVAVALASPTPIPEALRVGLLAFVAWLYEHRGDDSAQLVPAHVERLVAIYGVTQSP